MSSHKQQRVTGTVDAAPEQVFALLADPGRHPELDGAGMLRGVVSGSGPVSKVGDAFVMDMNQEGIGDYQMRNEIVAFEPGRRITWAPSIHPPGALSHLIGDMDPSGYTYGWELEPNADGGTAITHTYDWSGVSDPNAEQLFPRVSTEQMTGSIERLGKAAG